MSWTIVAYDGTSVELRDANFGDSTTFDTNAALNRNRSQEPYIVVDEDWPAFYTYIWPFTNVRQTEKESLEALLIAYSGLRFIITDHVKTVIGYIIDKEISLIEGYTDRWNFEIKLVSTDGWDPAHYLLLEDGTNLLLEDAQNTFLESAP